MNKEINENRTPKLLIIGHAKHSKDTMAEILHEHFGLKYISSSQAAADIFIYGALKDKYGYDISANDNNGNSVEICNISEKYIKQFQKNLNKLINNME